MWTNVEMIKNAHRALWTGADGSMSVKNAASQFFGGILEEKVGEVDSSCVQQP